MSNDTQSFISEREKVKKVKLGSVSESKKVQCLRRLNILCNSRLVFFFRYQEPFCLKSISNNAGEAVFVKHVVCICVVCLEVVGHNL